MTQENASRKIMDKCSKYKDYISNNNRSISEYVTSSIKNIQDTLGIVEKYGKTSNVNLAKCNAIVSLATVFEISWKMFFQIAVDHLCPQQYLHKNVDAFLKEKIGEKKFDQLLQYGYSRGVICASFFNFQNYKEIKQASKKIFGHDITSTLNNFHILTPGHVNDKSATKKHTLIKRKQDEFNMKQLLQKRHEIIHMAGDSLDIKTSEIFAYSESMKDYVLHSFFSFRIHGHPLIELQAEKEKDN